MITITQANLAEWLRTNPIQPAAVPDPMLKHRVCPKCGDFGWPANSKCQDCNVAVVAPMDRLSNPHVVLKALRISSLTDRYMAQTYLDQGVLCWVFEGISVETVSPVAIKVLKHELAADKKTNARFVLEAHMWKELKHPNIMEIRETGLIAELIAKSYTAEGAIWATDRAYERPFIVMEFLSGRNLKSVLQEFGPLGSELAIRLAINVLEALHCAHKQEIVHRDLKPSNIFVVPGETNEIKVKVSDFGLAERMFRQTEWTPQTTKTGSVYGDPSYLSPEYLIEQTTSPRSDLYALGCIMYECITGKSPLAGQHEFHTMIRHVKDKPSPFDKSLKVPSLLEESIFRAMEKDPQKRFESAEHMHSHLVTVDKAVSV